MSVIYAIQEFRSPFLDGFFRFLNYLDRPEFLLILIPAIWVGVHWKAGLKLFYILFLNSLVNQTLKYLFAEPRPFDLDPSVGLIHLTGYGLPSGAAQASVLLSGLLIGIWKSKWKWPLCLSYIILISFSRLYLGVHFPIDLLGGWIAGFILWAFVAYTMPRIEKRLETWKLPALFLLSQLAPLAALLWVHSSSALILSACGASLGVGLLINSYFHWTLPFCQSKKEFLFRAAIGSSGTYLLYLVSFHFTISHMLTPFLISLWISTGSVLACRNFLIK